MDNTENLESSKTRQKPFIIRPDRIHSDVSTYMDAKKTILEETKKYASKAGFSAPMIDFYPKDKETEIKIKVSSERLDKLELLRFFVKTFATYSDGFKINMDFSDFTLNSKTRKIRLDKDLLRFTKKGALNSADAEALIKAYEMGNPVEIVGQNDELAALGALLYDFRKGISFETIAGYDKVKQEINDTIILPLTNPGIYEKIVKRTRKYSESGIPRAILFEGASGTGKTTIAKIIASQVDLPMVYIPIESILSKWLGKSEKNLARIYDCCENMGRTLLFLDEIDALSVKRTTDLHEASRRILSVLLTKLGGLEPLENVTTIAATNRKDDLDSALISRFDSIIHFNLPTYKERIGIFSIYAKQLNNVEMEKLARLTESFSGGMIKRVCVAAERHWAAKYLSKEVRRLAPKIEEYVDILKVKENDHYLPQYQ